MNTIFMNVGVHFVHDADDLDFFMEAALLKSLDQFPVVRQQTRLPVKDHNRDVGFTERDIDSMIDLLGEAIAPESTRVH